ncbi:MAG: ABC transporter substrate-binding protein [Bryobacterales bacterium]|nr:ABC transporter substrate-binding protein [Bryobacterales bacterium]
MLLLCPGGLTTAASLDTPRWGGVLHVAQRAEPKTFNPVIAVDAPSREVLRRLHADLITINRFTQKTEPGLAESWTRSGDGTRYTLKLRKGVRFSDGVPFTADDVVFSWSVYLDELVHSPQRDLLLIEDKPIRVSKLDSYTVEFTLPQPYAAAERVFDSVAMLPRHVLEPAWKAGKISSAWTVNTPASEIVGLGPFRLKQYRPGEAVVLERNPEYWQTAPGTSRNLPYLDGIEFRLLPDEGVQLARFVSGDIDVLNRLSMNAVSFLQRQGASVTDLGPGLEYNFLCFNLSPASPKIKWFSKREFRTALSLAADRESMARTVFLGRATPIWGHVSPGNRLWYSDRIAHPKRSVADAKQMLKAAGFLWNGKGQLIDGAQTPVEFSILVSTSSPERMQMATMLQADYAQLGIGVNIAPLEFRSLLDRVTNTRQFDTVLLGLGGGDADPNPELNVWLSSGGTHLWNPNQKQPATAWEAEIDQLMEKQMVTLNPSERRKQYERVQEIVAEQVPMIFLVTPNVVVAQRGNVGNFRPAVMDHFTLWNSSELYLRKGGSGQ